MDSEQCELFTYLLIHCAVSTYLRDGMGKRKSFDYESADQKLASATYWLSRFESHFPRL